MAHFEFFISVLVQRIINTSHSASREENPNCTQMRKPLVRTFRDSMQKERKDDE